MTVWEMASSEDGTSVEFDGGMVGAGVRGIIVVGERATVTET
jgi:hypothetical protein